MRGRTVLVVVAFACVASGVALTHMNNIPAFVVIGPGYLVQAWLFEHHLALGGVGYQATMIGVSALVWTMIILALFGALRFVVRLARRARAA